MASLAFCHPRLPPLALRSPVPYVFLASCTAQRCPTIAACWSPRQPAMGTPASGPSLTVLHAGGRTHVLDCAGIACMRRHGQTAAHAHARTFPPHAAVPPPPLAPVHLGVAADLRQHAGGHPKQFQRGLVPAQRLQVHQVGAGGVADVGGVQPAGCAACRGGARSAECCWEEPRPCRQLNAPALCHTTRCPVCRATRRLHPTHAHHAHPSAASRHTRLLMPRPQHSSLPRPQPIPAAPPPLHSAHPSAAR